MVVRKTTDDATMTSNAMMGLSGLDTATMLKAMMKPYKTSITALSQRQQIVVWKQERYRDLITKLNDFKAKFFDYRNPATNITSAGTWNKMLVDSTGAEYVKITATGTSKTKSGTVDLQLMPTASSLTGREGLVRPVQGGQVPSWSDAAGSYLTINMDGIVRSIAITEAMAAQPDNIRLSMLQNALDSAFGAGMINVDFVTNDLLTFPDDQVLEFTAGPGVNQFSIIDGGVSTARLELGFGTDAIGRYVNLSNKVVQSDTLHALKDRMITPITFKDISTTDSNGVAVIRKAVEFTINDTKFQFTEFDNIGAIMSTINNSGCGAKLEYDNEKDCFKLTATTCGPGETIRLQEKDTGFLAALGLSYNNVDEGVPSAKITGGVIDPAVLATVTAVASTTPYTFNVTANGVTRIIVLNGSYTTTDDIFADVNAQLAVAFPNAGLSIGVDTVAMEWMLTVNIDKTAPNAVWSLSVEEALSSPGDAGAVFGLTDLNTALAAASPTYVAGTFGRVVIDGVILQVDRPTFEYDGVLYELKKLPPPGSDPIEYSIRADTDKIVGLVRDFVDAYNEVMRAIGEALGEKRDKDYIPLTDEQKADMSESEIAKWEAKVKVGLLRGDTNFISLSSKLRLSIFDPVHLMYGDSATIGFGLKQMGIDTKDYLSAFNPADNGALYVDEEALRYAIETNLDKIVQLFTKSPETFTPGADDEDKPDAWKARMQRRYDDYTGGIAAKFLNILNDYIRTTRGVNNAKGTLIEHAGVTNDTSDLYNTLTAEILEYDKRISALWDRYDRIEKEKIRILSQLETVITNAANQMSWMTSQWGQSGS